MKNLKMLMALLAALALVFAGYADNGAGGGSSGSVDVPEPNLGTGLTAITVDNAEDLLQAFGEFYGDYEESALWKFSGANLQGNNDDGYTLTVTCTGSIAPNVAITLTALNEAAANAKTNILEVFLSNPLEWESEPEDEAASAGAITATLSLLDSAADEYYIPASLQKITIALDPGSGGWNNSYYIKNGVYYVYAARGLVAWNAAAQSASSTGCVLLDDIDMQDESWTPVGSSSSAYTGTFDGGGHKVSNLTINSSDYVGFFGYLNGSVEGLGLEDADVTGSGSETGGIAGYNDSNGTITACWVTGTVTGGSDSRQHGAGIAGYNKGEITACYSTANVSGGSAGCIAADNGGSITACYYSTGNVTKTGPETWNYAGAIAGWSQSGTITACYWDGDVSVGSVSYSDGSDDGRTTKVDGNDWSTARAAMNSALSGKTSWYYVTGSDVPLTLTK